MSRDTARKIERSPNAEHTLARRDSTGTVSMTTAGSGTTNLNNTANAAFSTVDAGTPVNVLFTSASITVASGEIAASNTPFNLTVNRDGNSLTSTSVTATNANVTLSTSSTLTTPDNNPSWTFSGDVASGTLSNVNFSASRENRWV